MFQRSTIFFLKKKSLHTDLDHSLAQSAIQIFFKKGNSQQYLEDFQDLKIRGFGHILLTPLPIHLATILLTIYQINVSAYDQKVILIFLICLAHFHLKFFCLFLHY